MSWNRQIEIDFGALPVRQANFVISDAGVSPATVISGSVAYVAPTGKALDEIDMDSLSLRFGAGTGNFTINASGNEGSVAGKFKINLILA